MTSEATLPDPHKRPFLTPDEVAPLLGVSRSNVYRMINAGQLPTIQLGGMRSTRIVTAELLRSVMGLEPSTATAWPKTTTDPGPIRMKARAGRKGD